MKAIILNASPKGDKSITLQTTKYIEQSFSNCQFKTVYLMKEVVSKGVITEELKEALEQTDLIIFSYPVYKYQVPYYMYRFIELLKASDVDLVNKCAIQICSSVHFFDVTATQFMIDNCKDMGIRMIQTLSLETGDLLSEEGRKYTIDFWEYVMFCMENKIDLKPEKRVVNILPKKIYDTCLNGGTNQVLKQGGPKTIIITDYTERDYNLKNMILDFKNMYKYPVEEVNLNDINFKGGCLGCMKCAEEGKCFYKDEFQALMTRTLLNAEAVVYAFTIKEHALGSKYKLFEDRLFFMGHRPYFKGNTTGYLLSGNYSSETNLSRIITASNDMNQCFVAGVVTDEIQVDTAYEIKTLAKKMEYAIEKKMSVPRSFYGVGGMRIFRDMIYEKRGIMKADHLYYKNHGFYDFPQRKWVATMLQGIGVKLLKYKKGPKKALPDLMLEPYIEIIHKGN